MILPFLTGALAMWYAILGRRSPCFTLWLVTLGLFLVGSGAAMRGPLPLIF
ncbi:DUF5993 family protein [Bordetella genomosp. 1]|uniref:DUF5993 family protein n=1 Tax=Bordetella genomosp. 1 TaxID=1395607 RepID=UPI001596097D|nr:DUF5993 family protein [Bordetella genomosp. 1]MDQ8034153.1 DUF5993 family protein [Bordetella sp.]